MSPTAERVIDRIEGTRQKWWLFTLLTTAILTTCLSFGTLFAFMLVDALVFKLSGGSWQLPQPALTVMLVAWLAVTITMGVLLCRRLTRSQRSLEATARRLESEYPDLGSDLINLVQLSEDTKNENRALCESAIAQSAERIERIRFEGAAKEETRWRRFRCSMQTPRDLGESIVVLLLLLLLAFVCHLLIPNWGSAANRLMKPWEFVPTVGSVKIMEVTPEDTDVLVGASQEITVEIIDRTGEEPYKAKLFVTPEGEEETVLPMEPGDPYSVEITKTGQTTEQPRRRYALTMPTIVKPLKYRIEVGDSQTRAYRISVRAKPTISEVEVTMHYPAYLDRAPETSIQPHADLEAPQYTVAELAIRPSVPIAKGHIMAERRKFAGEVKGNGELLVVRLPLLRNTTFTVHMFNDAGHGDPNPRLNRATVFPDAPPTVELLKPPRQGSAAPGADIPVTIRAGDDHGIGRVRLEMKVKSAESEAAGEDAAPVTVVKNWTTFKGGTTAVLHHRLELDREEFQPGQSVLVRAVAGDKRYYDDYGLDLKPQETPGGWHAIRIVDDSAEAKESLEQLDSLRTAIYKILEKQIRAQVVAVLILHKKNPAEGALMAEDVRRQQVEIQKASADVVNSIGDTDQEERLTIKRVLNQLAYGDMLQAVQQCDTLVKVDTLAGYAEPVPELNATQARIVEMLRKLIDVARRAQTEALIEMENRPEFDLSEDAKDSLDDLQSALDEAMERQKKVIEASENLAKAPVDDFAEEMEQLVKTMEAAENDWSKFMNELNTDLSKLPEQDFANPSLLSELIEIQTEIKMAEDALLKKTADIAVPLEQLGAEMAEELVTNMEKWLPDEPDRERWSQEESLTDAGKEAPMAELPGELEDLIGDLLEEEEDLFDEMEDVSSSAADSPDHAGWDAADGPISSMAAKGVTGNRLPNTSEIGGRSGEGRSGKSSGEFVGDEAFGKGGRKTPTRLTPDPFMAGQIKDHSEDSQGGATGGGKESGEGGEGLEGPAPAAKDRDMNRLAGKQADLRNKAEGVDLQHFQVMGYHHTDLRKMIDVMSQIERDLKAGRYQNALRQRKVVVDGLGNAKQFLEGEFEVRQDNTVNLPSDIQEEIVGSMQDDSPMGWEMMNRQYFERLARGGVNLTVPEAGEL